MDPGSDELREAHDVLAEVYAERLAHVHDEMPVDRSVVALFAELVRDSGLGRAVADIGCGSGRLAPHLDALGLDSRGVDLSPGMIHVARRDYPGYPFDIADLRALPFDDASLAGALCWYSLMYLHPAQRPRAFGEVARVIAPGGYLVTAFKAGDDTPRRGGLSLGVEFDIYWFSPDEMQRRLVDAGFRTVFWGGRPAEEPEPQPQAYLIAQRL